MIALLVAWVLAMNEVEHIQHDKQAEFCELALSHRFSAFFGGLQAGKSVAGADALGDAVYGPNAVRLPEQSRGLYPEIWILSKSYALADQAMSYFRWRTPGCFYTALECKRAGLERMGSRTYWLKPNPYADNKPICCRVRTAHDPEALRATPVLLAAWCDEMAHWPELAWLNLQGRGIVTPTRYLITTTPKGKNWLYRDVFLPGTNGSDLEIGVVTCKSVDNPWADKTYLAKLRAKFGAEYAAQELDALFTANVGYVYDFDRTIHMAKPPSLEPDFYDGIVAGVDPGYGDPYAVGWWGYESKTHPDGKRRWWLLDEFYQQTKATTHQLLPMFKAMQNRWKAKAYYVDKRRPSDRQLLHDSGLPAQPNYEFYSETDRRTVMPMIRIVQTILNDGRIRFAPHCEWHAEEMENYAFPDREDKNRGENPQDWQNHCLVAETEVVTEYGRVPIERIVAGERVLTRAGWREVKKSWMPRSNARVMGIDLDNGMSLEGTPEHKIWVDGRGFTSLDSIRYGDRIISWQTKQSYSAESDSGVTQTPSGDLIASTSHLKREGDCIAPSGNLSTAKSQEAIISITGTGTHSTTESRISCACQHATTRGSISPQKELNSSGGTSRGSDPLPPSGMDLARGEPGTESTLLRSLQSASRSGRHATDAESPTGVSYLAGFAQTPASPHGAELQGEITFQETAKYAGLDICATITPRLELAGVRVVRVYARENADVYNLHVEGCHEFFANTILVSNCMDAMRYAICSVEAVSGDLEPRYRSAKPQKPFGLKADTRSLKERVGTVQDAMRAQEKAWDEGGSKEWQPVR